LEDRVEQHRTFVDAVFLDVQRARAARPGRLETMRVVEHQRLSANLNATLRSSDLERVEVPRRHVRAAMLDHAQFGKLRRPFVEVFRLGESAGLEPVVAPVETLIPPKREASPPGGVVPKRDPTDIEAPVSHGGGKCCRKSMFDDPNGTVTDLVED